MAWGESKAWNKGTQNQALYQALLDHAEQMPARNAKRKKVVKPDDMPWELSRHGLLKHLLNEGMNTRMETVDAYMLIIPPGSKSGKHRQLAEECLYVVEGRGYDIHVDYDVEITDNTIKAADIGKIRTDDETPGLAVYDPGFTNTASCRSAVTFIDGEKGILEYRGYPIEQLEDAPEYRPNVKVTPELVQQFLSGKIKQPA